MIGIIQWRRALLGDPQIALQKQRHCLFILPFAIVIEFVEQHDIGPHPLQDGCAVTYLTLIGLQRSEQIASSRTGKADIEGSNPDGAYWGRHRLIRQG